MATIGEYIATNNWQEVLAVLEAVRNLAQRDARAQEVLSSLHARVNCAVKEFMGSHKEIASQLSTAVLPFFQPPEAVQLHILSCLSERDAAKALVTCKTVHDGVLATLFKHKILKSRTSGLASQLAKQPEFHYREITLHLCSSKNEIALGELNACSALEVFVANTGQPVQLPKFWKDWPRVFVTCDEHECQHLADTALDETVVHLLQHAEQVRILSSKMSAPPHRRQWPARLAHPLSFSNIVFRGCQTLVVQLAIMGITPSWRFPAVTRLIVHDDNEAMSGCMLKGTQTWEHREVQKEMLLETSDPSHVRSTTHTTVCS